MKTCLATISTRAGTEWEIICRMAHEYMQKYATKCGVDFKVITQFKHPHQHVCWGKLELFEQLPEYDRILYVDSDILIRPNSPNLFEIVPEGQCALYNEDHFGRPMRKMAMMSYRDAYNDILKKMDKPTIQFEYQNKYYNAGVFMVDKTCNFIITPEKELKIRWIEQTYFNLIIQSQKLPVYELPYGYNAMGSEKNSLEKNMHFLHFAGMATNQRMTAMKRFCNDPRFINH